MKKSSDETSPQQDALPQYAFADQLATALSQDSRVRAVWLEGSLGRGFNADIASDIDLHILAAEGLISDVQRIVSSVEIPLYYRPLPFGDMMAMVIFADMMHLEIWVHTGQTRSITAGSAKVLYCDNDSLTLEPPKLANADAVNQLLTQTISDFWFGVSHHIHTERGELIAAYRHLGNQVDYFVTMLIASRGEFRNVGNGHYNQFLESNLRSEVETLLALPELTSSSLKAAHLKLADLMRVHGRSAAHKRGVPYPEKLEAAVLRAVGHKQGLGQSL